MNVLFMKRRTSENANNCEREWEEPKSVKWKKNKSPCDVIAVANSEEKKALTHSFWDECEKSGERKSQQQMAEKSVAQAKDSFHFSSNRLCAVLFFLIEKLSEQKRYFCHTISHRAQAHKYKQ